ncbi:unnamed protein product [Nippostrongylus brasiliensis]|uniref:BZIP domain-containing protein n=1 Tax=Nippostrongylus brasiliensis TaxID=27835 RepID=A0A0N4YQ10_NIPBR|nr:unnamed protein product [Nippostrongylus brasiliensis]
MTRFLPSPTLRRQPLCRRTLAGQSPSSSISSLQSTTKEKDPVARRKDFIRRRKQQTDQGDASKVIQNMVL